MFLVEALLLPECVVRYRTNVSVTFTIFFGSQSSETNEVKIV